MALSLLVSPSTGEEGKVLDVGLVLRLDDRYNGQFNETVSDMADGIETAKALFEEAHPGVKVVLHRYPHGKDLATVAAAADRLIKDKVAAVIGGEMSDEAFILRDKLGPRRIALITPTGSNPAITEGHPYSFRACFSDRLVASRLADFTADRLKPRAVGLIRNVSSPYADFLGKQFLERFNARMSGRKAAIPIYEEKALKDALDYSETIRRFIRQKVTHVVLAGYQSDLLRFVLQAADMGYFPVYVGSDGWGSNEQVLAKLAQGGRAAGRFVAFRNFYTKESETTPLARDFAARYSERHGRKPGAFAAVAFDAAWVLLTAMAKASDPRSGEAIREQLLALKGLELVTSASFAFGPDNSPSQQIHIYRLDRDGAHYEVALK